MHALMPVHGMLETWQKLKIQCFFYFYDLWLLSTLSEYNFGGGGEREKKDDMFLKLLAMPHE